LADDERTTPDRGEHGPTIDVGAVVSPRALNQRQKLEQEKAELLRELTGYEEELKITLGKHKGRRQFLQWHIRRVKLRIAEVAQELAGLEQDIGS